VIAAGTGLGEAGMFWDGRQHQVFACEGGHADFAPRNEVETELLRYLRARFGRVSYERVLSGPGLVSIYRFLRDTGRGEEPKWLAERMAMEDCAAVISKAALEGKSPLCEQALDIFVSIYGAEAGNLALKIMATGGVYVGGGIAPKILPKLVSRTFLDAFADKGRMRSLLESMPVHVIVNENTGLLGAARCAAVRTRALAA
jgi:glucokinase